MSKDKKVVQLRAEQGPSGPLPAVLNELHDCGWRYLGDHVQKLLDNADDALFELADRALNAGEQNLYFEAMREIRVHRRRIEDDFRAHLLSPFHQLYNSSSAATATLKPLELLDYDDMEEQVAVESMASKASKRFAQPLTSLVSSLEAWSASNGAAVSLNENQLPLGPLSVCEAFAKATQGLDISIKPKLVLFKLFDRHVVSEFGGLYQELTTVLKQAGLYQEAVTPKRPSHSAQSAPVADATADSSGGLDQPVVKTDSETLIQQAAGTVFDVLKGLLASSQATSESLDDGEKVQVSRTSLMVVLQDLQGSQLERLTHRHGQGLPADSSTELPADLAERLRGVSQAMMGESDEGLAQRDFDVINLVSLLFQYVLEDESLASPMRGLIAHLQIPVLKAAMLDKRFFSKEGHPARLLLNTIADACIGWQAHGDIEDDPLYMEIENVVKDVLSRADGSATVFQEALDEFKDYLKKEQDRADIITQRVLDADGSKEAAESARKAVDNLLKNKLSDAGNVPGVLENILQDGWSKVLFLQYVQQGEQSEAWQAAVSLVDTLIWSVQPVSSTAHRDKLLAELPGMLENLRGGLNQIGYNPYDLKEQLQQLEVVHLDRLKKIGEPNSNNKPEGTPSMALHSRKEAPPAQGKASNELDLDKLDASLAESLGEAPAVGQKELDEAERRLARLQVGNWVEFAQGNGKTLRCRLAAVIASTGRHIFVNRSGMKVAEYEKADLVEKLATDQMALLDDGMLFDRALESVISNLRDMKDKPV